jgi:hypothetical protein
MAGESTKLVAKEAPERAPTAPEEIDLGLYPTRREAAEYIAQMVQSLRGLARREDLSFLAYLLGLALEEARGASHSRPAGETSAQR